MARLVLALCVCLAAARTSEEKEAMHKAIRMRTSRQLKEIFEDLGIQYAKSAKTDDLRKQCYKEDCVAKYEKKYPEKARKKPKGTPGGGIPGMEGFNTGGDPKMEDLLRQMRGDFSGETDPERKRILEKLAKRGMSFGGGNNMDTEQLRNMEKMLDGINMDGFKGDGAGGAPPPEDIGSDKSSMDEDVEDKMEL